MSKHFFRIKVTQIQQTCQFELSWGKGQQIRADVTYPETLTQHYQAWQRAYIRYYQSSLRGRLGDQGSLIPTDPHAQLVKSEENLLTEFKTWLASKQLSELHTTIVNVIKEWFQQNSTNQIDLFLTCSPIELERLPWEAWEISPFASISLTRTPVNIRSTHAIKRNHQGRARILAIFGDQTGLDFKKDIQEIDSLSSKAEIKIIAWQETKSISLHKLEICQGISDPKGWDILFFAGHSQETEMTGGELAIAPRTRISIKEIEPYLKKAKANGLQFALFNSCSGLSIANALIDLGLNQVAIMREPIHNTVAQLFLVRFLKVLTQEKDVNEAVREACQFLKDNKVEYPSAYLIPSLFSHPEAKFFKIEPFGWRTGLKKWLPNFPQVIALSSLSLLSLLPPLQEFLVDTRILTQAIYREITSQIPQKTTPPVLLVSIDEESLNRENIITERNPLPRQYLAKIIDQLAQLDAKVVGIDYLLDRPQGQNDQILSRSIHNLITLQQASLVFASVPEGERENGLNPKIASLKSVMQGSIASSYFYLPLPNNCTKICPFSYLIAVNQALSVLEPTSVKLTNSTDYRTQILNSLDQASLKDPLLNFLKQASVQPITEVSEYFQQRWLQPIIDYSLPPETVYQTIPAYKFLNQKESIKGQVVLIASGDYPEARIDDGQKDYLEPPPLAIKFGDISISKFTGGQANAYMIHHWLNRHLVIPLPDLWLILVTAWLGRTITVQLESSSIKTKRLMLKLLTVNALFFLVSLQAYVSLNILFPFFLPSVTFWLFVFPSLRKITYEK